MTDRPNILILMVDQLSGTLFEDGPADFLHVPNLRRLADHSLRFANAYAASPACAPARAGLLTGLLPQHSGVFDDGAALAADIPTYAHHLRRAGYFTCLTGATRFAGLEQSHGFERHLPADFTSQPYGPGLDAIAAGVAEFTDQLGHDDEVCHRSVQQIYALSRSPDPRPWCLTASFAHPQAPFIARRQYWDLYENAAELTPPVPEDLRRARQGYFANISYLDDKIGQIFTALEATGQEAIVIFTADHGAVLGEQGRCLTGSFLEAAARAPLMISAPGYDPQRIATPVSTLDLLATLADLAGIEATEIAPPTDGRSLLPLAQGQALGQTLGQTLGQDRKAPVAMEHAAGPDLVPAIALRMGAWKYIHSRTTADQLYDLNADPAEAHNLAADPRAAEVLAHFQTLTEDRWNLPAYEAALRQSLTRRQLINQSLSQTTPQP